MPVTLRPHEHNNIVCILEYLNMKHILAFHKNVISNTLIGLFCSFYQVNTFVQTRSVHYFQVL